MNLIRKFAPLVAVVLLAASFTSCRTVAAEGTPQELQAVPTSQMLLLDSAITSIENGDTNWTDPESGNVLREAILAVLRADMNAWAQLDRFYNPDAAPAAPAATETE